jgi:hypothetical protein
MAARAVWKYALQPDTTVHRMPMGARLLSIAVQRPGEVVLYALVDPQAPKSAPRTFIVLGTGEPAPKEGTLHFIGTCTPEPGVWFHAFEVID